jgi:TetR/AcrR family tetracycline transcriptional repressor
VSTVKPDRTRRDLTTEEIAAVAARLMREEGTDGVTMRRVASECGVTAMALYHHVENKEELLTLVVDRVIGDMLADFEPRPDWRGSMSEFATTFRAALLANPGAATVFLRRPILSENLTRTTETLFEILKSGGFRGPAMAEATDAIVLLTTGSISNDLTRPAHVRQQLIGHVPAADTPLLVEHIGAYSNRDGEERFRLALGWLLDGIERGAMMS